MFQWQECSRDDIQALVGQIIFRLVLLEGVLVQHYCLDISICWTNTTWRSTFCRMYKCPCSILWSHLTALYATVRGHQDAVTFKSHPDHRCRAWRNSQRENCRDPQRMESQQRNWLSGFQEYCQGKGLSAGAKKIWQGKSGSKVLINSLFQSP